MRGLVVALAFGLHFAVAACSSAPPPTPPSLPVLPDPEPSGPIEIAPPDPSPLDGNEDVPRSIRRLVSEQRDEVQSIRLLAADIRDRRGRARAMQEAADLAEELRAIESDVLSAMPDSERLDALVVRLHRLETKTGLIHDALRQASL